MQQPFHSQKLDHPIQKMPLYKGTQTHYHQTQRGNLQLCNITSICGWVGVSHQPTADWISPEHERVTVFCMSSGGYYLTTLYAALYHISSFQPRLVARQLTVEAQHSLNQWHRRRTLHCDQSRRSKNRTTIRRQARCDSALQGSDTQWSGNKEEEVKARVDSEEPQHPAESSTTDLQVFKEETG